MTHTNDDELRTKFWEDMTNLVLEYGLYTFDPNIKDMERDLMEAFDKALTAYKKELLSKAEEFWVDDPETGIGLTVEAIPLSAIQKDVNQTTASLNIGGEGVKSQEDEVENV